MKKMFSLLLALLMCLALLPGAAAASEEAGPAASEPTVENAVDTSEAEAMPAAEADDGAAEVLPDAETEVLTGVWVNPHAGGAAVPEEPDRDAPALDGADVPRFSSAADAGDYVRSHYKAHSETIVYEYQLSGAFSWDIVQNVQDEALRHTGDPTEGDFLLGQLSSEHRSVTTARTGRCCTVTLTPTHHPGAAGRTGAGCCGRDGAAGPWLCLGL